MSLSQREHPVATNRARDLRLPRVPAALPECSNLGTGFEIGGGVFGAGADGKCRLTRSCTLQYKVHMSSANTDSSNTFRWTLLAVSEWLMVLPAALLLAAAALRSLQPPQHEPARTSWIIFQWTAAHVSRLGAALLFLGLPGVVAVVGCAALLRIWRVDRSAVTHNVDQALRQDAIAALAIFRRRLAVIFLTAATLLAGAFVVVHIITD